MSRRLQQCCKAEGAPQEGPDVFIIWVGGWGVSSNGLPIQSLQCPQQFPSNGFALDDSVHSWQCPLVWVWTVSVHNSRTPTVTCDPPGVICSHYNCFKVKSAESVNQTDIRIKTGQGNSWSLISLLTLMHLQKYPSVLLGTKTAMKTTDLTMKGKKYIYLIYFYNCCFDRKFLSPTVN